MDYKGTTNANPVNDIQTKYQAEADGAERQYLSREQKDDRTYGERVDDRLEAGYRNSKAIRKDAVKMAETTVQQGDITKESEEMQIEALKKAYEELKEMYGEENIISAVIPRRRDNAPSAYV